MNMIKTKYLLLLYVTFSYSFNLFAIQFTRPSVEGVSITYSTIDTKTCRVTYIDTSASGSVTIPSKVDGYDVISVHDAACRNCNSIESVLIPNTVTSIGWQAFSNCSSLVSIEIPNSVTNIGNSAFQSCSGLTSVIIPESVTSIGESTFKDCTGLVSITIPESVTSIGNSAFQNCESLQSIVLPNSLISIGEKAFWGCLLLGTIEIPYGVVSLESRTFAECRSLGSVIIPNSVTNIGNYAFYRCSALESVVIPNSVISIGENAFRSCSVISSITIPNSVTSIGSYAFSSCPTLKSITIPNSVTSIGSYAFRDCVLLETISLPKSIVTLGDNFVNSCSSLRKMEVEAEEPIQISSSVFNGIPNDVMLFVPYAASSLYKNSSWKNYFSQIQERLPRIGYVFNANIKNDENEISAKFSVINATPLEVKVGNDQSSSLEGEISGNIVIPSMVTLNDSLDFHVKGIGEYAFDGTNITSASIENGIEYVAENSFRNCASLCSVSIPNSIISINETFNDCCLNSVSLSQRNPSKITITNNAFGNLPSSAVLHVPAGTKERYGALEPWNKFPQIIESSPISIGDVSTRYDSKVNIPIILNTEDVVAGLQFKIKLPSGVTVSDKDDELITSTTERTTGMTIMGRKDPDDDNSYMFVMFSLTGETISGAEGAIMNINLNVADNIDVGVYNMEISDVYLATKSLETVSLNSSDSELTVKDYVAGDSNGDGVVDVTDIVGIANAILGRAGNTFDPLAADLNGDGVFDVTDIVVLANQILNENPQPGVKAFNISDLLDPQ